MSPGTGPGTEGSCRLRRRRQRPRRPGRGVRRVWRPRTARRSAPIGRTTGGYVSAPGGADPGVRRRSRSCTSRRTPCRWGRRSDSGSCPACPPPGRCLPPFAGPSCPAPWPWPSGRPCPEPSRLWRVHRGWSGPSCRVCSPGPRTPRPTGMPGPCCICRACRLGRRGRRPGRSRRGSARR